MTTLLKLFWIGVFAVGITVMMALAPPEWDATIEEFASKRVLPIVRMCMLLVPIAGGSWLVLWLASRRQPQQQSRKRRKR